jgi:hypothetical protein
MATQTAKLTPENLAQLRAKRADLDAAWRAAGSRLKAYPRDATGMILDSAKGAEWRKDRTACDRAFAALQSFNRRHKRHLRALSS